MDRRPGIFRIGTVRDTGDAIHVAHWGLTFCADGCRCHTHPGTGQLAILEDQATGDLGLVSYRPGCDCCTPWTCDELVAVVRDLADIDSLLSLP